MKTNAQIKISETRFPSLTRAVLRQTDRESLPDVVLHGADSGFPGFTYYSDTVSFFKSHRADIIAMAEQLADEIGQGMLEMISGFGCLGRRGADGKWHCDYSESEIAEALYRGKGERADLIQNAMAWFAFEEVARELNPEL